MSLTNIFGISGSAMGAQTIRLNTTASNLANAQSVSSSVGETYKARHPVFAALLGDQFGIDAENKGTFQSNGGVRVMGIVESDAPYQLRYEPHHPSADEDGYVTYPNVNVVEEMTNMISASRSFQMNVEVMNTAKTMMQRVMSLGQ
ncbi:MAG: flagellar basal body rod protein FlgC [Pseudomonadales bacterium]|nr:flagellar basal body rod protein FlgC [Pseudomonadales bacterium]